MKFGIYILGIESNLFKNFSINLMQHYEVGWGNGYILIPPQHPFHGKHYDDIYINIHGGLTFSDNFNTKERFLEWIRGREIFGDVNEDNCEKFEGYWMIGFDTAHAGDNSKNCDKYFVSNEILKLMEQCLDDNDEDIRKYKTVYLRKNKLEKINTAL